MNDAAKRKSSLSAGLTVLRAFLLIVACSGLNLSWAVRSTEAETRVWAFPAQPGLASGQITFATPSFVGENYDALAYDVSGSLVAAKTGVQDATYLYQKVGAQGEHLKFGVTKNPATRYTQEEFAGGRLRIVGQGERLEMLRLERQLHETLPIGPEERQLFCIQKQIEKGLKPPPYNP